MQVSISGARRTTIADVAKQAGVSTSSVSRHLKGQHVNGAAAIDAAMRDLDYRPSALARSLKSGRTDTIGLVVPDVTNPFFAGVVKGAESVAQGTGYQLVLCNTDESSARGARCAVDHPRPCRRPLAGAGA